MLESPQDESVVRWGNEGDSFVVLEACFPPAHHHHLSPNSPTEREVHQAHPAEAFQAQQFRLLCAPAK